MVNNKEELKVLLEQASEAYYNEGNEMMSDEEFDRLKEQYEQETGETLEVGANPTTNKGTVNATHTYINLLGSLGKKNSYQELKGWFIKTFNDFIADTKRLLIYVSPKFDGNSICIEYENGESYRALTRGRNGKGVDLTNLFKGHKIPYKKRMAIKYEVIVKYDVFKQMLIDTGESYANPRSVVAGILGKDDASKYYKYLSLVPLDVIVDGESISRKEALDMIAGLDKCDKIETFIIKDGSYIEWDNMDKIEAIYDKYTLKFREELNYMVDGLVIEIVDPDIRKKLGFMNSKPNYATALKFPYMTKQTVVTGFEFDLGSSSRITPMVLFKPVTFNGAVQRRVSLANYDRFMELKLGIGSDIVVEYRNETLSYVKPLNTENNKKIDPYPFASQCPNCGGTVRINENKTFAFCGNDECSNKTTGRIERYIEKLDIKDIGLSTIEKLYDAKLITVISDLYKLDYDKVAKIEGLGERSAAIIKARLEEKIPYDYEILGGLGIKDFGLTSAKELTRNFRLEEILDYNEKKDQFHYETPEFYQAVIKLEDFSHITAEKLVAGLTEFHNDLAELYMLIDFKEFKLEVAKNSTSSQVYTFCITGSITNWKNRNALKSELELMGHKVIGGVSSANYLINNDTESTSSKNVEAKKKGIPIISEDQLKKLLGI